MTTQDYTDQLNAILTAELPLSVEVDDLGNTMPANEYRAGQLAGLSVEIRRAAWTGAAHAEAHAIAARADEAAARLLGNVAPSPAPRFDAVLSNGIIHPAIH